MQGCDSEIYQSLNPVTLTVALTEPWLSLHRKFGLPVASEPAHGDEHTLNVANAV